MSLVTPMSLYAKVMQMSLEGGLPSGYTTGWELFDKHWTVRLGEMSVVTGIPGSGKSEFIDALTVNLAKLHKFHTIIFSPENHPIEFHVSKMLEKVMKMPFSDGPTPKMELEHIEKGLKFMDKHFTFLAPQPEAICPEHILNLAAQKLEDLPSETPVMLVIDPWNEVSKKPASQSETDYIGEILSQVRYWARQTNVHVNFVVHPIKLQKNPDGTYPCPTLYDCAGSAHWRNKCDAGLAVHRPNLIDCPHWTNVHVQKVRFRHVGKPGMVEFTFNPVNGTYRDHEPLHQNLR